MYHTEKPSTDYNLKLRKYIYACMYVCFGDDTIWALIHIENRAKRPGFSITTTKKWMKHFYRMEV